MTFRKNIKKCLMFFLLLLLFFFFSKKGQTGAMQLSNSVSIALYQLFGPKNLRYKSSLVKNRLKQSRRCDLHYRDKQYEYYAIVSITVVRYTCCVTTLTTAV